ncbi:MAG: hypothetical protein ACE5JM_08850 [Armatimonadota bacterium]
MQDDIEPDVAPRPLRTGPGSRLALASVVAVAIAILVLAFAAYWMIKAPLFHALAGGARGLLAPLASGSALDIDGMLCRAIVMAAIAISLWGAGAGALALHFDHAEVDRWWLGLVGVIAGILLPIVAALAMRWAWVFVARAHMGQA